MHTTWTRQEHYRHAEQLLSTVETGRDVSLEWAAVQVATAQVHATLAAAPVRAEDD